MFSTLNWNSPLIERARGLIAAAETQTTFSRLDLNRLCGQPNKPLARALRTVFIRKPEVVSFKGGEQLEFIVLQPKLNELKEAYAAQLNPAQPDWFIDIDTASTTELRKRAIQMRKVGVDPILMYAFEHRLSNRLYLEQQKQVSIFG